MINKKNVLGKKPHDLGAKDAIHVAIVAVRAGSPIKPGQRCGLNEHREAVPAEKNGVGVADPFMKSGVASGQAFWLLLDQDSVPNVRHEWEHPTADFSPPTRAVKLNATLKEYADNLGVTYEQLIESAAKVVENEEAVAYPGKKTADEVEAAQEEMYDLWSEWADETGHEFFNAGTACCPEFTYPDCRLFEV